ncbi:TldD/PmbA family protein [Sulfurisphaera ohwakuensis]|uniref:TldD/PmbA family protein n=1 Tax=Sulfurisphaera ohwakuensis TaxID=69656 RepID=UPI0036F2D6A7
MTDVYTIVQKGKELGYSIEVFMAELRAVQIKRERQYQNMNILDRGYGIRIIKDGKLGFAYGNRLDNLLDLALDSLHASKEDKFNVLPSPEKISKLNLKMFDIANAQTKINDYLAFGDEIREYVNVVSEYYEVMNLKVKIVSSEGIDVEEERSLSSISLSFNIKNDIEISPEIYEYATSRSLNINLDNLKGNILKMKEIFKKKRVKLEKPISEGIFTPKALSELFSPLFSHAISLENYYRGKSPLKEGEIINEKLEISDNPLISDAPYSRSFDAEGLPSKINYLIKDGKITQFLSNTYWSLKANRENTHSATRNYSVLPYISPTILDINVKSGSDNEGIFIGQVQGVHTSNFDTGEFSVVIPIAWNEKEGTAYKELTLSGNLKDFIKGIEGSVGEKTIYGNLSTSALRVKNVTIA